MNARQLIALAVVSCALSLATDCYTGNPNVPEPSPAPLDPSDVGGPAPSSCAPACSNLMRLGCPEGQPTPQGATCEQVCASAAAARVGAFPAGCLSKVVSCSQTASCAR